MTRAFPTSGCASTTSFRGCPFYRGARNLPGRYFGPFPSAGAVKETLQQLQKLFRIRNCRDTFFANRSRPCLQHQIGRCSAPCVGLITPEAYAQDIDAAEKVLDGRSDEVNTELQARMEAAAEQLQFERAAVLRDQLAALQRIQAQQIVTAEAERDVDVICIVGEPGEYAISVMLVRGGRNLGTTSYFPRGALAEPDEALTSFIMQYYATQEPPPEVLVSARARGRAGPLRGAHDTHVRTRSNLRRPVRGLGVRWLELNMENATQALRMRLAQREGAEEMLTALAQELDLPELPARIECFDISHTGGEGTVASCVVFGREGPLKKEYRRFNITGVTPGDDYGALRQALKRRYTRIREGEYPVAGSAPDRRRAGSDQRGPCGACAAGLRGRHAHRHRQGCRTAGPGRSASLSMASDMPLAPRPSFARLTAHYSASAMRHIGLPSAGHRRRRARRYNESILETVPGLGPAKRRALLRHFGGLQGDAARRHRGFRTSQRYRRSTREESL